LGGCGVQYTLEKKLWEAEGLGGGVVGGRTDLEDSVCDCVGSSAQAFIQVYAIMFDRLLCRVQSVCTYTNAC
jgi:hypothetical protein